MFMAHTRVCVCVRIVGVKKLKGSKEANVSISLKISLFGSARLTKLFLPVTWESLTVYGGMSLTKKTCVVMTLRWGVNSDIQNPIANVEHEDSIVPVGSR